MNGEWIYLVPGLVLAGVSAYLAFGEGRIVYVIPLAVIGVLTFLGVWVAHAEWKAKRK